MDMSRRVAQAHQEVRKREIFVLVDAEQYCYINQSVNAAHKARELMRLRSGRRWIACAIVEIVEASFSEAAEHARKWRAIASMNGYEEINNPRVLEYVKDTPLMEAVEAKAHWWPFKVKTLFPARKPNPRDEKFLKRDRHIYVIADRFMRCYVGQSVHPRQRVSAHFSGNGNAVTAVWLDEVRKDAQHLVVETVHGNYWDAMRVEYKWRAIAELNGFQNVDIVGALCVDDDIAQAARASRALWPFASWKSEGFSSHQASC